MLFGSVHIFEIITLYAFISNVYLTDCKCICGDSAPCDTIIRERASTVYTLLLDWH